MGLFNRKDPEVCPYLGEVDESGEVSNWLCRFPNRREEHCLITQPNEWEEKCTYVLEAKAAMEGRKIEVEQERSEQTPLVSQAKTFIDQRLGRGAAPPPVKASPEAIRSKTYRPVHYQEAQAFLLTNARPLIYNKEVVLFYIMPEEYDELVALLDGVRE